MMTRRLAVAATLAVFVLTSSAQAQRGRNQPAMTIYGPVFNPTQTPEWRQAGGNLEVWQQIMMEKTAKAEQAAFQKQYQAYQKQLQQQQKNQKSGTNPNGGVAGQNANNGYQFSYGNGGPFVANPRKKSKTKPKTAATAKSATTKAAEKTTTPTPVTTPPDAKPATPEAKPTTAKPIAEAVPDAN